MNVVAISMGYELLEFTWDIAHIVYTTLQLELAWNITYIRLC